MADFAFKPKPSNRKAKPDPLAPGLIHRGRRLVPKWPDDKLGVHGQFEVSHSDRFFNRDGEDNLLHRREYHWHPVGDTRTSHGPFQTSDAAHADATEKTEKS